MRWLWLLSFSLLCSSCGGASKTTPLTDGAQTALTAIETSLPAECRTESVKASLRSLQSQIDGIDSYCGMQLQVEKQKVTNRNLLILGLLLIIAFLVKKKLF